MKSPAYGIGQTTKTQYLLGFQGIELGEVHSPLHTPFIKHRSRQNVELPLSEVERVGVASFLRPLFFKAKHVHVGLPSNDLFVFVCLNVPFSRRPGAERGR